MNLTKLIELDCPLKIKSATIIKTTTESMTEEELWKTIEGDNDGKLLRVAWSKDGRPLEPELNANIRVKLIF